MANVNNPNQFEPPTAEQLAAHLSANPPVAATGWRARLPLILLVALGLTVLLSSNPAFALVPWLVLMGFVIYMSSRVRAARALQQRVTRAWELAMIRRYREALGQAWELVPACRPQPELHGRSVTVIAHILGELGRDEAADVAYGYLLDRLPPDHALALRMRVQRAIVCLHGDRLADADDQLRKLRGRAEASDDATLAAAYRMARLIQDVRTGHYADAAGQADRTADALRPLGVEAGYGHGLLALCFHQLARHEPDADDAQRRGLLDLAKAWWDKATLLIPASALLYRHGELRPLAEEATPRPRRPTDTPL